MKPQKVGLVDVGENLPLSLPKLAKILNGLQTSYHFDVGDEITSQKLGKPDVLYKWYEIPRLCTLVKDHNNGHYDYVIGIANCPLTHTEELQKNPDPDLNYFSRSDFKRAAVISVHESMLKYKSPGKDIYQYAAYLVITEALIMSAKTNLNHDERPFCVFYECGNREQLKGCMEKAEICHPCHAILNDANVSEAFITNAQRALMWCSKNSWSHVWHGTLVDPLIALIVGSGVGWFASIYLSKAFSSYVAALVVSSILISLYRKRHATGQY